MFQTLKKELNIVEVLELITEIPYTLTGEDTYIPEGDECPSCGHKNCFRIKHTGNNEESFAKCFSEDKTWDVISIVANLKEISQVEAAKLLAKHYNIKLPNDFNPMQEVFDLAAKYYHTLLLEAPMAAELGGLTPLEYQEQVRSHSRESIQKYSVGWSDGKLIPYLESVGISQELIANSGLMGKKGGDFLPAKVFIYPHFIRGRASHFDLKDPLKQKAYQLPNKYVLNGYVFYNSDSLSKKGPVALVEGVNDLISLEEHGWDSGILCTCGMLSATQIEWMTVNLKDRDVVTFYDVDPAGDTYREKTAKVARHFKSLTQIKLTGGVKDIDEALRAGADLAAIIENNRVEPITAVSVQTEQGESISSESVVEKGGCYYKVKYKEGEEYLQSVSDFLMEIKNIYIEFVEGIIDRNREVIFTRKDGKTSELTNVSSDAKTKPPIFKTLVANAVDGAFTGSEADLTAVWDKAVSKYNGKEVYLSEEVGKSSNPKYPGWLFGDCFIHDNGQIFYPDETSVIWISETSGIKVKTAGNDAYVPNILTKLTKEERRNLMGVMIRALAINLGSIGDALHMFAWVQASVHSRYLIAAQGQPFFPLLMIWGTHAKGKSFFVTLLLSLLDMQSSRIGIGHLNTGVSFFRKGQNYNSLPMGIDEIKSDKLATEWSGRFRLLYDRIGRSVANKNNTSGTKDIKVRSTFIFSGEDQFQDPATRSRCIPIRIRKTNRETVHSFKVLEDNIPLAKAIGQEWILESLDIPKTQILEEFKMWTSTLVSQKIDSRQARNWAVVSVFANRLSKEFFPEFNYLEFLSNEAKIDLEKQSEEGTLSEFWQWVEGVQSEENSPLSSDHFKRVDNVLYIWFAEVFRIFESRMSYSQKEKFSKNAILESIKEEDYSINSEKQMRTGMGMANTPRRVIALDITKAGETIQSIVKYLE
jgi:5S rRNA maturation endonuclease (ribonuclease M5)